MTLATDGAMKVGIKILECLSNSGIMLAGLNSQTPLQHAVMKNVGSSKLAGQSMSAVFAS
jgi:hypothetical protein